MKKINLDLDTKTIPGMAGEPMEIPVYIINEKEVTYKEWENHATEADEKRLDKLNDKISESNTASAHRWCV